jgi:hypothetical protein
MRPTTRISTPILRIQSGMAMRTSPKGRPDENDRRETAAVRQEVIDRAIPRKGPGLSLFGDFKSATAMATY